VLAFASSASATVIDEYLGVPSQPGNAIPGTFLITPSAPVWAFGVGNDGIQDTSISGIASINGLPAKDYWISTLISQAAWSVGYDFDSIRPIGSTPPSAFSIDTTTVPWLWGSANYVAYYWLSNADGIPDAILQPGVQYDAFRFFLDSPASPFVTWTRDEIAESFAIQAQGETVLTGPGAPQPAPEPATAALLLAGLAIVARRRQRRD